MRWFGRAWSGVAMAVYRCVAMGNGKALQCNDSNGTETWSGAEDITRPA